MVFQKDGNITSGTECDYLKLQFVTYLAGGFDQEMNDVINDHLNECDDCHKHLFKAAFPEG